MEEMYVVIKIVADGKSSVWRPKANHLAHCRTVNPLYQEFFFWVCWCCRFFSLLPQLHPQTGLSRVELATAAWSSLEGATTCLDPPSGEGSGKEQQVWGNSLMWEGKHKKPGEGPVGASSVFGVVAGCDWHDPWLSFPRSWGTPNPSKHSLDEQCKGSTGLYGVESAVRDSCEERYRF